MLKLSRFGTINSSFPSLPAFLKSYPNGAKEKRLVFLNISFKSNFLTTNSGSPFSSIFLKLHPVAIKKKGFIFAKVSLKSDFLIANSRSPSFPTFSKSYLIAIQKKSSIFSKIGPKFDISDSIKIKVKQDKKTQQPIYHKDLHVMDLLLSDRNQINYSLLPSVIED